MDSTWATISPRPLKRWISPSSPSTVGHAMIVPTSGAAVFVVVICSVPLPVLLPASHIFADDLSTQLWLVFFDVGLPDQPSSIVRIAGDHRPDGVTAPLAKGEYGTVGLLRGPFAGQLGGHLRKRVREDVAEASHA